MLFGKVQHDGAGFEDRQRFIARIMVHDGRHAVVWTDLEELGLELVALADVHRNQVVGNLQLFQKD